MILSVRRLVIYEDNTEIMISDPYISDLRSAEEAVLTVCMFTAAAKVIRNLLLWHLNSGTKYCSQSALVYVRVKIYIIVCTISHSESREDLKIQDGCFVRQSCRIQC